MYPACLIGSRAVALMGVAHALVSLADRLPGNHLGHQTWSVFIGPFHALLNRELFEVLTFLPIGRRLRW
jgi:hypothetical protein